MEKIRFKGDLGEEIELYVIDTTKLAGEDYLLASDVEAGDGECYIFKDVSPEGSAEARFKIRRTRFFYCCCNRHGLFRIPVK